MAASCNGGDVTTRKSSNTRRSKPSKRITAARFFLKNISLDGKSKFRIPTGTDKGADYDHNVALSRPWRTMHQDAFDEEQDKVLISALPTSNKGHLHHSTSVASTNIFKENTPLSSGSEPCNIAKSKSFTSDTTSVTSKDKQQILISRQSSGIRVVDANHFLTKTVRHMGDKRAVLVSQNGLPFGSISLVPYRRQEKNSQIAKENRISGTANHGVASSVAIEGVEVGGAKKSISYNNLLVPVLFQKRRYTEHSDGTDDTNLHQSRDISDSLVNQPYHPYLLDDPELTSGKHRKVLNLKGYSVSVIEYAKPSEIKKDINERFKEKFPNTNITLSKLRSIKMDMFEIGMKCGIDRATIACSHVYFEKLVFKEKITKLNRKYCAGACVLLASKFNGDIKKGAISSVIESIVDRFRLSLKELLHFELLVLIALEFQLCLPPSEVNPMYKRLETMRSILKSRNKYSYRNQHASFNHYRNRSEVK